MWIIREKSDNGKTRLDWRLVGNNYWTSYKANIDLVKSTSFVNILRENISLNFTLNNSYAGGVRMLDGRVFFVPYNSTVARIYNSSNPFGLDIASGTYPGGQAYIGGVLLQDGRVFCIPHLSTSARIYDPSSNTTTTPSAIFPGNRNLRGGVLLPDGRVFCVPSGGISARIYDPKLDLLTIAGGSYPNEYFGGVLLSDGRVFCVPFNFNTSGVIYDPSSNTTTNASGFFQESAGGVLLPDGRVFCVGNNGLSTIYDPVLDTTYSPSGEDFGIDLYRGGCLLPDGKVLCVPYNSESLKVYDPILDTTTYYNYSTATEKFFGGVSTNGRIVLVPFNGFSSEFSATTISNTASRIFDYNVEPSSYYNKF